MVELTTGDVDKVKNYDIRQGLSQTSVQHGSTGHKSRVHPVNWELSSKIEY